MTVSSFIMCEATACPRKYSKLLHKMGLYFLDTQYVKITSWTFSTYNPKYVFRNQAENGTTNSLIHSIFMCVSNAYRYKTHYNN